MVQRFETFVSEITKIYRSIQKIKIQEMADFGLKGTHVMCLFYLQQHEEGLTATQLAQCCGEDKAAISRALKELSEKGLIHYHEIPGQRRYRSLITLTERGNEVTLSMNKKIRTMVDLGAQGFSAKDRQIFYRVLVQISNNLEEVVEREEQKNETN